MSITLIVGLGNPGPRYATTRHNAGVWLVDQIARRYGGQFRPESKFYGEACRVNIPLPVVPPKKGKESVASVLPQELQLPQEEQSVTFAKPAEATLAQRVKRVISLFHGKEQDSNAIAAKRGPDSFSQETDRMATCWLLKPTTFMNRSGQAVAALANYYKIPVEQILVVHDDLDFPPGTIRLKKGGGDGRHNGLKDIIAQLGNSQFLRLRLGIGHPGKGGDVIAYVLNAPLLEEKIAIDATILVALEVIPLIVAGKVEKAMQVLHSQTRE